MLDLFGREINYLRISVTDRCNLRCIYCMPATGVEYIPHNKIISFEKIEQVAQAAAKLGFVKLRLTGGEPLVRRGIENLISLLKKIPQIKTIGMTTNATLLAPIAKKLKQNGLSSVNISLDTLDPQKYEHITRGGKLEDAINGIMAAKEAELPVKLNVVVGNDTKGDIAEIQKFAQQNNFQVQTIREYRLDITKSDDIHFDRPSPCEKCNRLRLLSTGELKPCLHSDKNITINWDDIENSIKCAVMQKPVHGGASSVHLVSSIGG